MATQLLVNGRRHESTADPARSLLSVLRDDLSLTGCKYGCGEGECGACTVLIDGKAVRSCITPLADCGGKAVTTVEGLADGGKLHAVQQAFLDCGAMQCGYCTTGMIMSGVGLLAEKPQTDAGRDHRGHERQHLPLRHVHADHCRDPAGVGKGGAK